MAFWKKKKKYCKIKDHSTPRHELQAAISGTFSLPSAPAGKEGTLPRHCWASREGAQASHKNPIATDNFTCALPLRPFLIPHFIFTYWWIVGLSTYWRWAPRLFSRRPSKHVCCRWFLSLPSCHCHTSLQSCSETGCTGSSSPLPSPHPHALLQILLIWMLRNLGITSMYSRSHAGACLIYHVISKPQRIRYDTCCNKSFLSAFSHLRQMITALTTLNLSLHKSSMSYETVMSARTQVQRKFFFFDILIILNNQQLQCIICFWIGKMIENTPFSSCNFKNKDYINI